MAQKRYRKFQITINNPWKLGYTVDSIILILESLNLTYYCFACEEGTCFHIHIFIYRETSGIRFNTLKEKFPGAHIENCYGTCCDNRDYILKEGKYIEPDDHKTSIPGTFFEFDEYPSRDVEGKTRQELILKEIEDGNNAMDIIEKHPSELYRVNDLEHLIMSRRCKEFSKKFRPIDVIYIFGPSGTGKTKYVFENEDIEDIYRVTNYPTTGVKFDGYTGQNVLVFEEFGSKVPLKDMLSYLDIYPLLLPARYHDKIACYTKVYITSNESIEEQYKYEQENQPESYNALLRRINRILQIKEGGHMCYIKNENPVEVKQRKESKECCN